MTEITPQMRQQYKQECSQGVDLFQRSLEEYQNSQIPAQKAAYKNVMDKALQVIRETVPQCLSQAMQKEEATLEKDYQNYINNPSPANLKKVTRDLQQLKKEI